MFFRGDRGGRSGPPQKAKAKVTRQGSQLYKQSNLTNKTGGTKVRASNLNNEKLVSINDFNRSKLFIVGDEDPEDNIVARLGRSQSILGDLYQQEGKQKDLIQFSIANLIQKIHFTDQAGRATESIRDKPGPTQVFHTGDHLKEEDAEEDEDDEGQLIKFDALSPKDKGWKDEEKEEATDLSRVWRL